MRKILITFLLASALPGALPAKTKVQEGPQRCLSTFTDDSIVPFDNNRVLIRIGANKRYLGYFKGNECRSMRQDSRLIITRFGSQICNGDRIRPFLPGDIIPGAPCILDHFEPYTEPPRSKRR